VDCRKKSAFFQNHAGQKIDLKSGSEGQFINRYIFQDSEHFGHRLADPSISFAPASPACHPLGKALLSPGLLRCLAKSVDRTPVCFLFQAEIGILCYNKLGNEVG
jgi:hypothetical protein